MNQPKPGDRIYVRRLGDGDGHAVKRVNIYDIVRENEISAV